jgi:hypothetical protein
MWSVYYEYPKREPVLRIRDVYPGSRIRTVSILDPESEFLHPGSRFRIFLPIPDPGSRGQKGTGSRIPDPDPQHCKELIMEKRMNQ